MPAFVLAALLAALLPDAAAARTPLPDAVVRMPAPAWVDEPALAGIDAAAPRDGVAYVLVDDQVSLLQPSTEHYRRLVFDVVERDGLEEAGRLSVGFQPDYQQVRLHRLRVVREGANLDRLDAVRAEMLRREARSEEGILDGERTLELLLPDIRVGDRLDLSYSIVGARPVFAGGYHGAFTAGYGQGVGMRRILASAPADRPLYSRLTGQGYSEQRRTDRGVTTLSIVARPLAAVVSEGDAPDWFDGFGHLDLSTSADWSAVATWSARLYRLDRTGRDAAAGVARDLALAGLTPDAVLATALAWVQREVRYLSLSLGENAYTPASPALTLERRFGDCKDKASLLIAVLAAAGIDAEPVLVNTSLRHAVADHLPTPLAFDHVIVRARIDGEWRYVDPTRGEEVGEFADREPVRFGVGLPVVAGAEELARIPVTPATHPQISVVQDVRVLPADAEGPGRRASIHVATTYRRGYADSTRARFRTGGREQVGRDYLGYMQGIYGDIRMADPPELADVAERNELTVEETYDSAFEPDEDRPDALGNLSLRLFQIDDWVPEARRGERQWPLALKGPEHGVQEIRMIASGGWAIEPERHLVENEYFRFERELSVDGELLTIRGDWKRFADEIPATAYAGVRGDLHRASDLLGYSVIIGGDAVEEPPARTDALAWPAAAFLAMGLLLAALWPLRRSSDVAGMLFFPRGTSARLVEYRGAPSAMAILVLVGIVAEALDVVPTLLGGGSPAWGTALLSALATVPQQLLFVALLLLAFRLFGVRAGYGRLFVAVSWASWPMILLIPLALVAAGPAAVAFADGGELQGGASAVNLALLASAILTLVAAVAWTIVASIGAASGSAGTSIGVAAGAYLATAFVVAVIAISVALALYAAGVLPFA